MGQKLILSFGEIVWDQFGEKSILGGAPLNVAYHLHMAGAKTRLISRIGSDQLGRETIDKLRGMGLDCSGVQVDDELASGRVFVTLDDQGQPSYDIADPAAWDAIGYPPDEQSLLPDTYHLVFGTLSQRHNRSRESLAKLIAGADTIFYDVNLRPPHTTMQLVKDSLDAADVVKVNVEELELLGSWFTEKDDNIQQTAATLLKDFALSLMAVTDGDKGAWLISGDGTVKSHPGFQVTVCDPVGSGDGFFSVLIRGFLESMAPEKILIEANRLGAWIASRSGATPPYE
ncbi:MAG: carbohydrate kinase [Thermodesulfobacteriota bacterium]